MKALSKNGSPSVVFFAMADDNHFQRLRAVVSGVVRHGATARVFTHSKFAPTIVDAGAELVDMFTRYPLEAADNDSIPIVSRYVTYAACYAESIAQELRAAPPSVIVADTFAVIGRVVATILDVPFVNVCAGHNMTPSRVAAEVAVYPRIQTAERCHRAVEILRDRYGDGRRVTVFLRLRIEPLAESVLRTGCLPHRRGADGLRADRLLRLAARTF